MSLYEQTDFASDTETLVQWRHRCHPVADRVAIALIPVGIVGVILLAFIAAAVIAKVGP